MSKNNSAVQNWSETISNRKMTDIRAAACPPGQAALWLHKHLDDNQLAELYFRVFERNEPFDEVARIARDAWGVKPNWEIRDFRKGLEKWKAALTTTFKDYIDTAETPKEVAQAKNKLDTSKKLYKDLDVLEKLAYAIEVNSSRLEMAHSRELMAKIPLRITDEVTRTLSELCRNYTYVAAQTGVVDGSVSEFNINFKAKADFVLDKYVGNDANKMIRAATEFIQGIEKKCITLNLDPDTQEYKLAGESETDHKKYD